MADYEFSTTDYVLCTVMLLGSTFFGIGYSLKGMLNQEQPPKEIFLGNGSIPAIAMALSLVTSFLSGITLLAIPAEVYRRGALYWISRVVGTPIALIITMLFVLPVLRELDLVSIYSFLQYRFKCSWLRRCSAILYLTFMMSYISIVLYAPATALSSITKVPAWIFFVPAGVLCSVYSAVGGFNVVVWTDCVQCFFMLFGLVSLFFKGIVDNGGFSETFTIASEGGLFTGLSNSDPNPFQYMTIWTSIFGGIGFWTTLLTFNQVSVQRYLSLGSLRKSQTVLAFSIPGYMIICTLADLMGVVMYTYYSKRGCDPISAKVITPDQLVINYALDVLGDYRGMPGMFLACLFSGTFSTISSGINSMTVVTWEDFVKPYYKNISLKGQNAMIRFIGLTYGFLAIGLSLLGGPVLTGILKTSLTVLAALGGPVTGLFLLGLFIPFANKTGAFIGLGLSVSLTFVIAVGNETLKPYIQFQLQAVVDQCVNYTLHVTTTDPSNPLTGLKFVFGLSPVFYATFGILVLLLVSIPASLIFRGSRLNPDVIRPLTAMGYYKRKWNRNGIVREVVPVPVVEFEMY